jgi:hypothetical protein
MSVTTSSGSDVKNTSQLKGEAKESAAFKEKNQTTEYVSNKGKGEGPWGGENASK